MSKMEQQGNPISEAWDKLASLAVVQRAQRSIPSSVRTKSRIGLMLTLGEEKTRLPKNHISVAFGWLSERALYAVPLVKVTHLPDIAIDRKRGIYIRKT
jgi:hypothetical protein